jgi:deoxycytidine triphosphate deaminase
MVFGLKGRSAKKGASANQVSASALDIGVTSATLSDDDAEQRFKRFKTIDPFPDVAPALLNSAHVGDYMRIVALVWPYDLGKRKAASYAMRVGNQIAYHDPAKAAADPYRTLNDDEEFELPPNSLVYVRTKERFQLPDYIAARFNLHIDLVHKGLLLGTGPVVDPGFIGQLVVPLHNLTRNTYVMRAGQDLIWAEFTKTSSLPQWEEHPLHLQGGKPFSDHKPFDKAKSDHEMAWYINKAIKSAGPGKTTADFPANSIPDRIVEMQGAAQLASTEAGNARADAEKARKSVDTLRTVGGLAIAVLIIGLGALFVATFQLVNATQSMVREERDRASSEHARQTESYRAVLRAEVLMIEMCDSTNAAATASLKARLVQARRVANDLARRDGAPLPFAETDVIADFKCAG